MFNTIYSKQFFQVLLWKDHYINRSFPAIAPCSNLAILTQCDGYGVKMEYSSTDVWGRYFSDRSLTYSLSQYIHICKVQLVYLSLLFLHRHIHTIGSSQKDPTQSIAEYRMKGPVPWWTGYLYWNTQGYDTHILLIRSAFSRGKGRPMVYENITRRSHTQRARK